MPELTTVHWLSLGSLVASCSREALVFRWRKTTSEPIPSEVVLAGEDRTRLMVLAPQGTARSQHRQKLQFDACAAFGEKKQHPQLRSQVKTTDVRCNVRMDVCEKMARNTQTCASRCTDPQIRHRCFIWYCRRGQTICERSLQNGPAEKGRDPLWPILAQQ